MIEHDWRTLVQSREPKFWVKGTELEVSFPKGFRHRFAVYGIRTIARGTDGTLEYDRRYTIRDSHTISDSDVKNEIRPKVVFSGDTLEEVEAFLMENARQ